jgi:hypothetical protein
MAMHIELQKASDEKIRVYDRTAREEVHIIKYAIMHGEDAARQKLREIKYNIKSESKEVDENVVITNEPEAEQRNESEKGSKKLQPVEYKGNYLGGQKAIKDKIFNRSRGSKSLQNATTLLFYLIQHSAWEGKNDKHKTYKSWYAKKRLIVASRSQEQMALDLGVSVSTIKRWLDDLERDKLIERAIEGRENVYILGKVIGDTELFFYEKDRAQN